MDSSRIQGHFSDGILTLADELVELNCGKTDGGYQFHEWTEYQPSKESVVRKGRQTPKKS